MRANYLRQDNHSHNNFRFLDLEQLIQFVYIPKNLKALRASKMKMQNDRKKSFNFLKQNSTATLKFMKANTINFILVITVFHSVRYKASRQIKLRITLESKVQNFWIF